MENMTQNGQNDKTHIGHFIEQALNGKRKKDKEFMFSKLLLKWDVSRSSFYRALSEETPEPKYMALFALILGRDFKKFLPESEHRLYDLHMQEWLSRREMQKQMLGSPANPINLLPTLAEEPAAEYTIAHKPTGMELLMQDQEQETDEWQTIIQALEHKIAAKDEQLSLLNSIIQEKERYIQLLEKLHKNG